MMLAVVLRLGLVRDVGSCPETQAGISSWCWQLSWDWGWD